MKIILLGPPGAGKGTMSIRMAADLQIPRIVTGDLIREEIKRASALGQRAKAQAESGALVSDDLVIEMVRARLAQPEYASSVLFDGFPRSLAQAQALERFLNERGARIDLVIEIDVADEKIIERLSNRRVCGSCQAVYNLLTQAPKREGVCDRCSAALIARADDEPDTIRKRLAVYRTETAPLIEYYKTRGAFARIDGSGSVTEVYQDISKLVAVRHS